MSKGKKRDYSLPPGVTSRAEQARLAKNWQRGKNEFLPNPRKDKKPPVVEFSFREGFKFLPGDGGGYREIPQGTYYWDESGKWDKEALAELLKTVDPVEPEPKKSWEDEWYEKNKDSI